VKAEIGDEIVVDGAHLGDLRKMGKVLEVLTTGGVVHYRVQWDDGHEGIFYPGSDAHTVHPGRRRAAQ